MKDLNMMGRLAKTLQGEVATVVRYIRYMDDYKTGRVVEGRWSARETM